MFFRFLHVVIPSDRKIEEEFDKELNKLVLLLTSGSQTDPYLANLAHGLQGGRQDI